MKMKKVFSIFVFTLFFVSCGNKGGEVMPEFVADEEWDVQLEDSVKPLEVAAEVEEMKAPAAQDEPSSASSSHHVYHNDNMRGFDPASEDDTHDNGMSRFMENNDDEGWD